MIGTRSATSLASHQSLPYGKRCASSFAPDAMAMQTGLDIFDVPARMIDEEAHSPLSPKERLWRDYLPSQFRPQAAPEKSPRQVDPASVETEQETTSQPPVVRVTTQKRVYSPPAVILFDGPARPQRQPETATRHRRSASSLSMPRPLIYTPPVPIIYDGPANPKRRKPVASTKADVSNIASHFS